MRRRSRSAGEGGRGEGLFVGERRRRRGGGGGGIKAEERQEVDAERQSVSARDDEEKGFEGERDEGVQKLFKQKLFKDSFRTARADSERLRYHVLDYVPNKLSLSRARARCLSLSLSLPDAPEAEDMPGRKSRRTLRNYPGRRPAVPTTCAG
jgi:hypothetical protein